MQCDEIDPCQEVNRGGCHQQVVFSLFCTGKAALLSILLVVDQFYSCWNHIVWLIHSSCCFFWPLYRYMFYQAACTKLGPGKSRCDCIEGWVGDGTYCYPSTPCESHGHCHANARCEPSLVGQVSDLNFHSNDQSILAHFVETNSSRRLCNWVWI